MNFRGNPVYVLGAGFTKAFVRHAPLMFDDYPEVAALAEKYDPSAFPHAHRVIKSAIASDGRIDIERLMTRLDVQMPYDEDRGASDELSLLLSDVKNAFTQRINEAREQDVATAELSAFAKECISRWATVITFNYDDILDAELYRAGVLADRRWSPDAAYGFVCAPSLSLVRGGYVSDFPTAHAPMLLKLHGSMNWRTKRGYVSPYTIDALVHDEPWFDEGSPTLDQERVVQLHLRPDPFIVPPVLTKSDLSLQPVLRLVWSLAFEALSLANRVVFVGYSMPVTDIAAKVLFREAISRNADIRIINKTDDSDQRKAVELAYRSELPSVSGDRFDYDGARAWADRLCAGKAF